VSVRTAAIGRAAGSIAKAAVVTALASCLLAACGSDAARSLVVVSVKLASAVDPKSLTEVEVTVTPAAGAVAKRFAWSSASGGVLQAGVYLPGDASGDAMVGARGFAGTTAVAASAIATVHIAAGGVSTPIDLLLQPLAVPPTSDGGLPVDGAADAGGSPADGSNGDGIDNHDAGVPVLPDLAPPPADLGPTTDTVLPIDAGSPDAAVVANPPSLARCTEYMHTVTPCNLSTGEGDWGVRSVAFSPDGKYFVSAGEDGRVKVWRVTSTGLEADGRVFAGFGSSYAAFAPGGALLAVGTHNGEVLLYDFAQSTQTGTLRGLTGGVTALGFSADGARIVAMDNELHLQVWNVASQAAGRAVALTKQPSNFAIAPGAADSLWVALQQGENAPLELLNLDATDLGGRPSVAMTAAIWGLAFSADGNTLAAGSDAGEIVLVNVANRAQPMITAPPLFTSVDQDVMALAFSRDGQYLLAATGQFRGATAARIFSVSARSPRGTGSTTYFPWSAAFAPDSASVAVGQRDCGAILYCKD
jgi:WD40 repeat protein